MVAMGADAVVGDLGDRDVMRPLYRGVDAVFLLAGYPDAPAQLADMKAAGVRKVVLLSSGCVVGGDLDNDVVRFNVVSEAAVRDSGLTWTVLRPSGFTSNTVQWADQLKTGDVVIEPFADVPIAVIDPQDIGAVAALALTETGHESCSYRLTGPEVLLPTDRARILSDVLGRRITLQAQPDDDARASGVPDAFFQFFRRGGYDDARVLDTVPILLGRPARTFREWAIRETGQFR